MYNVRRPTPTGICCRQVACTIGALLLWLHLSSERLHAQNVGVGTFTPTSSALLDVTTTSKGLLIPRVTNTQMNAIVAPATGLIVYNSTNVNFYYYNGTQWVPIVGQGWSLTGDAGTSASTNFLGTIDAQDVVQKTNYRERMRFFSNGGVGLRSNYNVAERLIFYTPDGTAYTAFKAKAQASDVHYRLPLGDGSPNAALITDGTGNLSWKVYASIGGGGSVTLWQRGSGQKNLEGVGSGNHASGQKNLAAGISCKASGQEAMVWGSNNQGSGQQASIPGGEDNQASGNHGTIRGGSGNQASGTHGTILGGEDNQVSGSHGTIMGGKDNTVSGQESTIAGGINNTTSGTDNFIFGNSVSVSGSSKIIFKDITPPATVVGIGTDAPSEALQVEGNVKFSGALKPGGSGGTNGQYLKSAGTSTPTWGTITVPTNNWRLSGTSGTSPATNFIGTTDAVDFAIRTNNSEALRINSSGRVGIGTSSPTHQLTVVHSASTDETAAIYGEATAASTSQAVGVWGAVTNTASSNTGTIGVLATGNGNSSSGTTNAALQVNDGELAMGRGTTSPSRGSVVESSAAGTAYSQAGPSGVIDLSLGSDLSTVAPTSGVFQDIGTVTINNRYVTANSIVLVTVVAKVNGGAAPEPKNAVFRADVESRTSGSFVCRFGMIPTSTDASNYQGSDHIRVAYVILNPGK